MGENFGKFWKEEYLMHTLNARMCTFHHKIQTCYAYTEIAGNPVNIHRKFYDESVNLQRANQFYNRAETIIDFLYLSTLLSLQLNICNY